MRRATARRRPASRCTLLAMAMALSFRTTGATAVPQPRMQAPPGACGIDRSETPSARSLGPRPACMLPAPAGRARHQPIVARAYAPKCGPPRQGGSVRAVTRHAPPERRPAPPFRPPPFPAAEDCMKLGRTALAAATLAAPLAGAALLIASISAPVYALADCGWAGPPWYPPAGGLGQSPRPSCITAGPLRLRRRSAASRKLPAIPSLRARTSLCRH